MSAFDKACSHGFTRCGACATTMRLLRLALERDDEHPSLQGAWPRLAGWREYQPGKYAPVDMMNGHWPRASSPRIERVGLRWHLFLAGTRAAADGVPYHVSEDLEFPNGATTWTYGTDQRYSRRDGNSHAHIYALAERRVRGGFAVGTKTTGLIKTLFCEPTDVDFDHAVEMANAAIRESATEGRRV